MTLPSNIIANADDFGLNPSVNNAILYCFENNYINSTSMLTNSVFFDETVNLLLKNPVIQNIGVHINLVEGKPVSNFQLRNFLDDAGNWDIFKTKRVSATFDKTTENAFLKEIFSQIDKILQRKIDVVHIDSHHHIHTLPGFCKLFIKASEHYGMKLRLAQTFYEGSCLKFAYRNLINRILKNRRINYSDYFENVQKFLQRRVHLPANKRAEIMLHPDFNTDGKLTDHFDDKSVNNWILYLRQKKLTVDSTIKN